MSETMPWLLGGGALAAYLWQRSKAHAAATDPVPRDAPPNTIPAPPASITTSAPRDAAPSSTPAPIESTTAPSLSGPSVPPLLGRWVWPVEVVQGRRAVIVAGWQSGPTRAHRGVDLMFPPSASSARVKHSARVESWRPLVTEYAGQLDVEFLLAWIGRESGGNPCSVGLPGKEAGLFQSYHPDNDRFGATFAMLRAPCREGTQTAYRPLTPAEERIQVSSGVQLVRYCLSVASAALDAVGARWGAADRYCLAKLVHALPAYVRRFVAAYVVANSRPPATWAEFRAWVRALPDTAVVRIHPAVKPWSSVSQRDRLFDNAERVGMAASRELPQHVMPPNVRALAASDGRVWSAEWTPRGFAVVLDHAPHGLSTHYAHLAHLLVAPTMRGLSQQRVYAGQPIGIIGADPQDPARRSHLHFELWRGSSPADAVDPAPWMQSWEHIAIAPPSATSAIGAVTSQRNAGRASLVYRSVGRRGEPYPEWVRALDGKSGVYVIREIGSDGEPEVVYVGESHTRRLYDTLTRHFQIWRRAKKFWQDQYSESHDPGLTYDRNRVDVAVRITADNNAIDEEARLIRALRPRDNLLGQPEDDIPF